MGVRAARHGGGDVAMAKRPRARGAEVEGAGMTTCHQSCDGPLFMPGAIGLEYCMSAFRTIDEPNETFGIVKTSKNEGANVEGSVETGANMLVGRVCALRLSSG
jgi:hypothetical protein